MRALLRLIRAAFRPSAGTGFGSYAAVTLCDIRGPLPFGGVAPFAVTAAVLVLAGLLAALLRRKTRCQFFETHREIAPPDSLSVLAAEYREGELAAAPLFERLAHLVGYALVGNPGHLALTSDEILRLAAADGTLDTPSTPDAVGLLKLCDAVKFARYQPSAPEIDAALDAVALLLATPPAKRP